MAGPSRPHSPTRTGSLLRSAAATPSVLSSKRYFCFYRWACLDLPMAAHRRGLPGSGRGRPRRLGSVGGALRLGCVMFLRMHPLRCGVRRRIGSGGCQRCMGGFGRSRCLRKAQRCGRRQRGGHEECFGRVHLDIHWSRLAITPSPLSGPGLSPRLYGQRGSAAARRHGVGDFRPTQHFKCNDDLRAEAACGCSGCHNGFGQQAMGGARPIGRNKALNESNTTTITGQYALGYGPCDGVDVARSPGPGGHDAGRPRRGLR